MFGLLAAATHELLNFWILVQIPSPCRASPSSTAGFRPPRSTAGPCATAAAGLAHRLRRSRPLTPLLLPACHAATAPGPLRHRRRSQPLAPPLPASSAAAAASRRGGGGPEVGGEAERKGRIKPWRGANGICERQRVRGRWRWEKLAFMLLLGR